MDNDYFLDYNDYADIMEYSEGGGKWTRVGEMSQAKVFPGVTIIDFDQFKTFCR